MSAHPKVDPKTGDLYAFGYSITGPYIHLSIIDKNRKITLSNQKIRITSPRMIHDFIITENYIVIPDLPMEANPPKAIKNKGFLFQYDKTAPSRYGVMKKGQEDI